MQNKVLTFGEIMMRLQPPNCDRFRQAKSFDIVFGGGEANVAVCLAQLGDNASFFTCLPPNDLGMACVGELKKYGVNTDNIIWSGQRIGLYFCEKGYSQRPSRVIYDRKNSSFSDIDINAINWEEIYKDVSWIHTSGITPALSNKTCDFTLEALKQAKKRGICVSCDLNYRKNLWSQQQANATMTSLMQYVDVLIANEEDAKSVFGIVAEDSDINNGNLNKNGYISVCKKINEKFGIKTIAITLRESFSANHNGWSAILYTNNTAFVSQQYDMQVLDRVGGGDSFAGGLIHCLINNIAPQDCINYAVACSCLKHSVNGDFNIISNSEVEQLIKSGGNGRVVR